MQEYEVEIEKINLSSEDNKGMEIHVTDPELLKKAGGIVQGMSGAPLLHDGKCIGAVTHVFVRDVTRGYATFLENLLPSAVKQILQLTTNNPFYYPLSFSI